MLPIALDAQAARHKLAIARPCAGQRVPGVLGRATEQLPEPEISGLRLACVMAAEPGSRAAVDTVVQHSGAAAVAVVGAARISC
jgi:hypothetical protein